MIDQAKTITAMRTIGEGFMLLARALEGGDGKVAGDGKREYTAQEASDIVRDFKCPNCGGHMVARRTRMSGEYFAGCRNYPDCKGTRSMEGVSGKKKPSTSPAGLDMDDEQTPY